MTNVVITWVEKELGILKTEVIAIKPEILAWATNFLATITPVIKQAAEDAVLAAVTVPGSGAVKFAAAVASAAADLATQGIPVVENNIKAAVQIAYNALPTGITSTTAAAAVQNAVNDAVSNVGDKVAADLASKA